MNLSTNTTKLSVWILEGDRKKAEALQQIWTHTAGTRVTIRTFSTPDSLLRSAGEELPDLITGECFAAYKKGKGCLPALRSLGNVDLFPVTAERSVSAFTLAQRCGIIDYVLQPYSYRRLHAGILRYLSMKEVFSRTLTVNPSPRNRITQSTVDAFLFSAPVPRKTAAQPRRVPDASDQDHFMTQEELQRLSDILLLLRNSDEGLTAEALGKKLNVSRTCCLKDLTILISEGLVYRHTVLTGRKGRPPVLFSLDP